jgi:hypothetical protein
MQFFFHLLQYDMKALQIDLSPEPVKDLDKAAHMSSLEPMGKIDVHIDSGNGLLKLSRLIQHSHRIGYRFDANLPDAYSPVIMKVLYIFHVWAEELSAGR